jgi:hypothetical protein
VAVDSVDVIDTFVTTPFLVGSVDVDVATPVAVDSVYAFKFVTTPFLVGVVHRTLRLTFLTQVLSVHRA